MERKIEFGKQARTNLVRGIDKLADAVVSTLGPNGRNVVIFRGAGEIPQSTKDGVTVAKSIVLDNPSEELGVLLLKQAAINTANKAGDGTTTSTLLAREIVKQGLQRLNDGANAVEIKRGIDSGVEVVLRNLKKNSEKITSEEQLEQIATISSNNDPTIGKLISTAIEKVGREGVVHIEESRTGETYLETVEGMQFDRGFKSPYFVTNNSTMASVLNDVYVLIADYRFTSVKELLPILEGVSQANKSLLVIAEDIDGEALSTLVVNKMRGTLKVCAVRAPEFGDRRKLLLEDIAVLTGGTVFDKDKGMKLDKFNWEWFGEARTVTVTKDTTTIVDGKGDEAKIQTRAEELESQIDKSTTPYEMEKLQERLAKFIGGVAIVHVGGNTETEMKEKKDRVDDALQATKAALIDGIVPGGGVALLYAREDIKKLEKETIGSDDFKFGMEVVYRACGKPFEQILFNAGYSEADARMISLHDLKAADSEWAGYNIKTKEVVNMKETGILDPHKVTKNALQNAASIAGTILLTEAVIVDAPEDKKGGEFDMSALAGMM